MDEREAKRIEYALADVREWATFEATGPEAKRKVLGIIELRVNRALHPRSDDSILRFWHNGDLSEEGAYKSLGVTRLEARVMLQEWEAQQEPQPGGLVAAASCAEGHEWREATPYREECLRCGKTKTWESE